MEARELRIGNYYNFSKIGNDDVGRITAKDILELEQDPIDDIYYEVPLTEDWLKRFGFKEHQSLDGCYGYKFRSLIWVNENQIRIDNYGVEISFLPDTDDKFKYVHQLQNLYFALTGEELKLKEDDTTNI